MGTPKNENEGKKKQKWGEENHCEFYHSERVSVGVCPSIF